MLSIIKRRKANYFVTFRERFFLNTLLNGREEKGEKWRENEEEGLSSYSVTLRR
jgi:hypothetical protein